MIPQAATLEQIICAKNVDYLLSFDLLRIGSPKKEVTDFSIPSYIRNLVLNNDDRDRVVLIILPSYFFTSFNSVVVFVVAIDVYCWK